MNDAQPVIAGELVELDAPLRDRLQQLAVTLVLGVVAVAVVIGAIVLAARDKSLPGELIAIGSSAVTMLGNQYRQRAR